MTPRTAAPFVALLLAAISAAGCAERYESVDQNRPYYEGGDTNAPPACPGSDTPTDVQGAPSDGGATDYECPSGDTTTHPTDGGNAGGDGGAAPAAPTPASPVSV